MKDSAAIQIAKNLPGVRINIKADLDWIICVGVMGAVAWKMLEYSIAKEKRGADEKEEGPETSEE